MERVYPSQPFIGELPLRRTMSLMHPILSVEPTDEVMEDLCDDVKGTLSLNVTLLSCEDGIVGCVV